LTAATGSFASANYPSNYPDEVECQWLIKAQPGQVVNINFTAFNTERRFDFVYFFDGESSLYPVIFGLDGARNTPPTGIQSSGESLFVLFTSDALTNATGFSATYQSVDASTPSIVAACLPGSRPLELSGSSGVITSPYYGEIYPLNCDCRWLISAQVANEFVRLDFTNFLTQPNNDWVVVNDGPTTTSPLLARLSGNYPQPPGEFTTTQRFMLVRFSSSGNIVARGFSATFTSVAAP